jgi:hypothetical protein
MRISQSLSGCGLACQRLYFNAGALSMTTKLDKPIRREIVIEDKAYTLTIDGDGLKLVEKGRRNGQEVRWRDLVSGDTALNAALNASTSG